jgi:hypothetical protein
MNYQCDEARLSAEEIAEIHRNRAHDMKVRA